MTRWQFHSAVEGAMFTRWRMGRARGCPMYQSELFLVHTVPQRHDHATSSCSLLSPLHIRPLHRAVCVYQCVDDLVDYHNISIKYSQLVMVISHLNNVVGYATPVAPMISLVQLDKDFILWSLSPSPGDLLSRREEVRAGESVIEIACSKCAFQAGPLPALLEINVKRIFLSNRPGFLDSVV
ncbi:hypothetical protein J6590_033580 [Homalodisca vitripennis]|nr:hypothetical protein J6590_033580 [Homalodisca vitripennis]